MTEANLKDQSVGPTMSGKRDCQKQRQRKRKILSGERDRGRKTETDRNKPTEGTETDIQ